MNLNTPLPLLKRAKQELRFNNPDRVEVLLDVAIDWLESNAALPMSMASKPQAQTVELGLSSCKTRETNPLMENVCNYLRMFSIGYAFRYRDITSYIEVIAGIALDMTPERSGLPRYRRHMSKALETLTRRGILKKGVKKTEYLLVKHP